MADTRYAPDHGVEPDFDAIADRAWQALTEGGNSEGITEEQNRETVAERMVKYGGKSFKGTPSAPRLDEEPAEPLEAAELVIPKKQNDPYWYEPPQDQRILDHIILTRRALGRAFHGGLIITGQAGFGKTGSVIHAVKRLNETHGLSLRLTIMDCATVTDEQKWFGRREAEKGTTRYVESDLVEAVRRGDIILLDDLSRIHPRIANSIFGWLDHRQSITLSDLNVTIDCHPDTVFLATANQGAQYGGTHRLDWAWRERFPYTIEKGPDKLPKDEEMRILVSHTGIDQDGAKVLVDVAARSREMWATGDIRSPISTRTLVAAAWLVASGATEREALEYTAIPLFDTDANGIAGAESDRQKVSDILKFKTGR